MSHVVVFNQSAKTVKIPTTPCKYLTEVRDEACQKFNVSKDQFTLKYNNKPLSLSQQIRLANLPQGARLELVQASRSPTVISVALQLPASDKSIRLTQKFASNTSLWEILRQFESTEGANYNFTQRGVPELSNGGNSGAGRMYYEMPVITVMPGHREQGDFVGLQQTLSQLGFDNGSALLKLSFKNSGRPLEEAMSEISQYFKSSEPSPNHGAHASTSAQRSSAPTAENAAPEATEKVAGETTRNEEPIKKEEAVPDPMDTSPDAALVVDAPIVPTEGPMITSEAPLPKESPKRSENVAPTPPGEATFAPSPSTSSTPVSPPAAPTPTPSARIGSTLQIFAAPTSATPQAARTPHNEADYVPSKEEILKHQASLAARTRNQRLLSDVELDQQAAAQREKLLAIAEKGSTVRVRFPDQTIIQTNVGKDDTSEKLYDWVTGFLSSKLSTEPFLLKYTSPMSAKQELIPRDVKKKLIQDLKFSRQELITFLWADNASADAKLSRQTLAEEYISKAQALKVEEPAAAEPKEEAKPLSKSVGKRKAGSGSNGDKESKLKGILNRGLFKR